MISPPSRSKATAAPAAAGGSFGPGVGSRTQVEPFQAQVSSSRAWPGPCPPKRISWCRAGSKAMAACHLGEGAWMAEPG